MDGTRVEIAPADEGGRCGVWVDADGKQEIEMHGTLSGAGAME
jgi:hypothetical protein